MSVVTAQIRPVLRRRPAAEKVLVTSVWHPPQGAVTLRDRLALEGAPSAALLDRSVADLASAAAEGADTAGRRLSSTVRLFLVRDLVRTVLRGGSEGYFDGVPSSTAFVRSVASTLRELRLAGATAVDLEPGAFVAAEKGEAVRALLSAYEERLEQEGRVDEAGLLRTALREVEAGRVAPAPVLMVDGDLELAPLEARFLDAYPAGRRLLLGPDRDLGVDPGPARARHALSGFRPAAPSPTPHRAGFLFRTGGPPDDAEGELSTALALGAENEVRSVFRAVASGEVPLDGVEVAYPPGGRYRSLLLSDADRFDVRCTFADGVPVELTGPGQALRLFFEWILDGHDDRILRRALRSGLLDFREADASLALLPSQAAALLRDAKVGRGRRRYGGALRRLRGRIEDRVARRRTEGRPVEALRRRAARVDELRRLLDPEQGLLWTFVPPDADRVPVAVVARRSRAFLDALVARRGRLEPPALESLSARLEEVEREVEHRMPPREAVRVLRDEIESHPVSRSGPRPGSMHASPLASAGRTGRERLVVVGMGEATFPGRALEDPLLLDRERRALPLELPLRRRVPSERRYDLARTLGEAGGGVRVLASVRDVASDRELYPGSAFLRAHRVATGDPDRGLEACLRDLRPPLAFTAGAAGAAAPHEVWLARRDRGSAAYRKAVHARHAGVRRGRAAERRRASDRFTAWDGRVTADPARLDPRQAGVAVSPSRLETLVESPFRYFLRYVLGVEPVDELEREPGRWLDPLARGRLLHRLFHAFMSEVTDRGERPDPERHGPLLERLAERLLSEARRRTPPPTEAAFRRESRGVRRTAEIFLRDEADRAEEADPWAFEVRIGLDGADGSPGSAEPVELELGEAGPLRLRGSVDRVDRLRPGVFRAWDYKTGSTSGHDRADPIGRGRLQWLLYALALERLLGDDGAPARVVRSGYLFPGERAHGDRMEYEVDARAKARLEKVLTRHLDLVAAGLFPHAPDVDACRWCDFRLVCGDPEVRAREAARKADATGPPEEGAAEARPASSALREWRRG